MTEKELRLAGRLLELAADEFAKHGCNDMETRIWGDLTKDERKELVKEYYFDNEEPDEAKEGRDDLEDYCVMRFLAEKLKAF